VTLPDHVTALTQSSPDLKFCRQGRHFYIAFFQDQELYPGGGFQGFKIIHKKAMREKDATSWVPAP